MENPLAGYFARTGRSKYALAKAAGLPWKTIHRVATGRHAPGHRIAKAISEATDGEVSIDALLSITPAPAESSRTAASDHAAE